MVGVPLKKLTPGLTVQPAAGTFIPERLPAVECGDHDPEANSSSLCRHSGGDSAGIRALVLCDPGFSLML
jgi:hypothetical protein